MKKVRKWKTKVKQEDGMKQGKLKEEGKGKEDTGRAY
jgi:hypothetical protein